MTNPIYPTERFGGLTLDAPLPISSGGLGNAAGDASELTLAGQPLTISITATQIPALTLPLNVFRTIGYAAAGDGGDAIYVKATSSGPMAVQDASGQWWALAKTGEWSAKAWGAKGDGVTDDTAALNAWFAGCVANLQNGFAPPGVYMHRGLTLNATGLGRGVVIRGAHAGSTIFRTFAGTTADILRYNGSNGYGNQSRCVFVDLTLDGNNFNSAHGVNIDNSSVTDGYPQAPDFVRVTVLHSGLDSFYYGIGAQNGVMTNCAGSHPGRNALNLNSGDNYFNRCLFYGANNVGLRVSNAANNGAGLVRLTVAAHGKTTGQSCHVWSSIDAALGTWTVTVIDANTLDLQGSIFSGSSKSGGNCIPVFTVTGAANNGAGLIRIQTSAAHGFSTGAQVWLKDIGGVPNANGGWVVTVIDATHFDLQGSQIFTWTYTSGGTARAFAANVFIGALGAAADNVLRDCNVYMGMFGTVLTNASGDIFQQVGGSIDSNFLAGVTIQTYGRPVAHAFTDTRFVNNSSIGAGQWSDIVISNTGSTVAGGSHTLGNQAVNYLVESDGTCTAPLIWRASFDNSGGSGTPWVNGAVPIKYDINVGFARQSITLGGSGNLANTGSATAGRNCNSSGNYSFGAGLWGNTRSNYGFTAGQFADDLGAFSFVWGGYRFSQNGDNQVRLGLMASCVTTDATPKRLLVALATTPSATNTLNLFYNYQSMAYDRITILCKNPATGDTRTWVVDNLVAKRGASQSAITLNGSSSTINPAAV
jgi:hypothetical protein